MMSPARSGISCWTLVATMLMIRGGDRTAATAATIVSDLDDEHHRTMARLREVHLSPHPVLAVGRWTRRPSHNALYHPSAAHLICVRAPNEQGYCFSEDGHRVIEQRHFVNGLDTTHGYDLWRWEPHDDRYRFLEEPEDYGNQTAVDEDYRLVRSIVQKRRFHIVGDSLSRQWRRSFKCVLWHRYGLHIDVNFYRRNREGFDSALIDEMRRSVVPPGTHDFLIFNFGHHFTPAIVGRNYMTRYRKFLTAITKMEFPMPDANIYYRTTSARHFENNKVDFTAGNASVVTGATAPNNNATWYMYGGFIRMQPEQNLLAIDIMGKRFKILDTAPMMLARADATYDGTHFCIPGPMELWTRMLLYRIYHEHGIYQEPLIQSNATTPPPTVFPLKKKAFGSTDTASALYDEKINLGSNDTTAAASPTFSDENRLGNNVTVTSAGGVPKKVIRSEILRLNLLTNDKQMIYLWIPLFTLTIGFFFKRVKRVCSCN